MLFILRYQLNHLKMWLWDFLNKVNNDVQMHEKKLQMLLWILMIWKSYKHLKGIEKRKKVEFSYPGESIRSSDTNPGDGSLMLESNRIPQ